MRARQWAVSAVALLSLVLLAVGAERAPAAQHWPPWQTFGEAEAAEHARLKRVAPPQQNDIDQLNRKVNELRAAGKLAEATPIAAQAVRLTEKRNGPNHPATAAALSGYAELLIAQKRYGDAEPILKRVVAIHEKSKDTAATAQALDNLAQLYAKQGRAADAKSAQERSAALRSPGKNAPVTAKKSKPSSPPIGSAAPSPQPLPAKPGAPVPQLHTESKPIIVKPEAKTMAAPPPAKPVIMPQIGSPQPQYKTMSREEKAPAEARKSEAPSGASDGDRKSVV